MTNSYDLDLTDHKIIDVLQKECKISTREIAEKVGLSVTATYERIKKIESIGIIKKQVAIVDYHKLGFSLMVFCNIVLKDQTKKTISEFENIIKELPEILEVYSISGRYSYLLKVLVSDISEYNDFISNKLANIEQINDFHSSVVFAEIKSETACQVVEQFSKLGKSAEELV